VIKIPLTTEQKNTYSSKEKIDEKYKPPRSGGRGVPFLCASSLIV
jgi:hypothetical protein